MGLQSICPSRLRELWTWNSKYRLEFYTVSSVFAVHQWGILEGSRNHSSSNWMELYPSTTVLRTTLAQSYPWTTIPKASVRHMRLSSICQVMHCSGMLNTFNRVPETWRLDPELLFWVRPMFCWLFWSSY